MLTLMLLRHAKAVQHGRGDDASRDLAPRGEADARALGARMRDIGLLPDLALVSSAVRTRATFALFEGAAATTIASRFDEALYNASARELQDRLRFIDHDVRTLMIVGHNPGIMDAAGLLARDGDPVELGRMRDRFPPGALAVLGFQAEDWRGARASGGRLDLWLMPEDIAPSGRAAPG